MQTQKFSIGLTARGLRAGLGTATNIDRAIRSLHRVLHEIDWVDRPDGIARRIHIDFGPQYPDFSKIIAAIDVDAACLIICIDLRIDAPGYQERVVRFVTRANAALLSGSFDVDLHEGTVHFRTGVVFGAGELSEETIRATLGAARQVVDSHAQALRRVASGQADADDAIEAVWIEHEKAEDDDAETA
jgi:hypothetical protein